MEKMEKERLLKELEMMNFEQRRCTKEQELIKEEQHQRWIQDRMHQEQKIRELEELAKTLEEDKMKREQMHEMLSKKALEYHHNGWNDPKQGRVEVDLVKIMKEESASQKKHCTEVVPKYGNDMQGKTISLGVCSYPGQSEAERLPSPDLLEWDQDIVEEQQRILETILNERKQEELNEKLARSLCSGPQVPQPLERPQLGEDGQPPTCQRRSEGQKAQGKMNAGFSGWEKVVRRKKHSKSESQSSLDGDSKAADEFLLASRLKEREEQARRSSRNNTHQKVLLVTNFTEEASGGCPSPNKKEQEPLVDGDQLSLASRRRRVSNLHLQKLYILFISPLLYFSTPENLICFLHCDHAVNYLSDHQEDAAKRKAWEDRQEQRCLERGRKGKRCDLLFCFKGQPHFLLCLQA